MNTKDFLRMGVPLGQATRQATDFVAKFILGGGDKSRLREEVAAIVAKGNAESLNSAAHGAGRAMSRNAANEKFNWKEVNRFLRERGVTLISAGLDEMPMAYKNIREVMAAQNDLVTVLGQFDPRLVKMAPSGERPED
jgi:RNA-splicing ligase RtcB